jgi:cytochrome oxidase Cu insertion factor (SCO1/SenC/PrrC family)
MIALGAWFAGGFGPRRSVQGGGAQVVAGSLDDLVMDLGLVPLDGQAPKPFALESLDGQRVALVDLRGRPALLYFWATW